MGTAGYKYSEVTARSAKGTKKLITVTQDEEGFTHVRYREDKRPLKLCVYRIEDPDTAAYFGKIVDFVIRETNDPKHLAKMEPAKVWALVERLSTLFCKQYSPTKEHGFTKAEIRGAVYFVLNTGLVLESWPHLYDFNDRTFVQWVGDTHG